MPVRAASFFFAIYCLHLSGIIVSEQSQIYKVVKKIEETEGFKTLETKAPEVADAFKQVNKGKMEMSDFKDTLTKLAETADDMENIQLVCYNAETGELTIIDPISIDKENKTIKVALEDHCYFSIISDEVKTAE